MRRRKTWALMLSGLMIFPLGCGIIPVASLPESQDPAQDAALKKPQASQKIDIIGASTPYPAIKLLASAYQSKVSDLSTGQKFQRMAKVSLVEVRGIEDPMAQMVKS